MRFFVLPLLVLFVVSARGANTLQTAQVVASFENDRPALYVLPPRHERRYNIGITDINIHDTAFVLTASSGNERPVRIFSEADAYIHLVFQGADANTNMSCVLPGTRSGAALSCTVRVSVSESAVAALSGGSPTYVHMEMASAQRDSAFISHTNASTVVTMQHGDAGNEGILTIDTTDPDYGDVIAISAHTATKHRKTHITLTWPTTQTDVAFTFHASVVAASASQIRRSQFFILALFVSAFCLSIIVFLVGRTCVAFCMREERDLRYMQQNVGHHNLKNNVRRSASLSRHKIALTTVANKV